MHREIHTNKGMPLPATPMAQWQLCARMDWRSTMPTQAQAAGCRGNPSRMVLKDSLGSLSSLALWLFSSYEPAPYVSTQSNFLHRFQHLQKTMLETVQKITVPSAWRFCTFRIQCQHQQGCSDPTGGALEYASQWEANSSATSAPRSASSSSSASHSSGSPCVRGFEKKGRNILTQGAGSLRTKRNN